MTLTNEPTINSLYLKYLIGGIDTLTAQDSVDIAALALACPVEAGSAVYKARILYAQYQPLLPYNDSVLCDPQNNNARFYKSGEAALPIQHTTLKLYPNPVKNVLNIEYPDAGILELSDMTSRKVRSIKLNDNSGGKLVVNISELPTGVYTCRYIVENLCVKVVKIELHHE